MVNKIEKSLVRWSKKKVQETQIAKIKNEIGFVTTDSTEVKKKTFIRDYIKKL